MARGDVPGALGGPDRRVCRARAGYGRSVACGERPHGRASWLAGSGHRYGPQGDRARLRREAGDRPRLYLDAAGNVGMRRLNERLGYAYRGESITVRSRCHFRERILYRAADGGHRARDRAARRRRPGWGGRLRGVVERRRSPLSDHARGARTHPRAEARRPPARGADRLGDRGMRRGDPLRPAGADVHGQRRPAGAPSPRAGACVSRAHRARRACPRKRVPRGRSGGGRRRWRGVRREIRPARGAPGARDLASGARRRARGRGSRRNRAGRALDAPRPPP